MGEWKSSCTHFGSKLIHYTPIDQLEVCPECCPYCILKIFHEIISDKNRLDYWGKGMKKDGT
jgi:hypothetical protein